MKKLYFLVVLLLLTTTLSAQTFGNWKTFTETDPFSGSFKAILTVGNGGEFPYQTPKMVINWFENSETTNIYFTDAGYAGCGGLKIQVVFDSEATIYDFYSHTNTDKDAWFFPNNSDVEELYLKMKKHSVMHVRLVSDCGTKRFQISLMGFTRAFNWIFPEYENELKTRIDKKATHEILSDIIALQLKDHIYRTEKKEYSFCYSTVFSIDYLLTKEIVEETLDKILIKNEELFEEYVPPYLNDDNNWVFGWVQKDGLESWIYFIFTPSKSLSVTSLF